MASTLSHFSQNSKSFCCRLFKIFSPRQCTNCINMTISLGVQRRKRKRVMVSMRLRNATLFLLFSIMAISQLFFSIHGTYLTTLGLQIISRLQEEEYHIARRILESRSGRLEAEISGYGMEKGEQSRKWKVLNSQPQHSSSDIVPSLLNRRTAGGLRSKDGSTSRAMTIKVNKREVALDNGIVKVTFSNPEGFVIGIQYGGLTNVLEFGNSKSNRGYWDVAWDAIGYQNQSETRLKGQRFQIIEKNESQMEISFVSIWNPSTTDSSLLPLNVDRRYVMLRGSSGFYSYAIMERKEGWPTINVGQIRAVYKLQREKFSYMAVSDKIQREMPMPQEQKEGRVLAYEEAVILTNPINQNLIGEVDDKYQYSVENKDNKLHGWISYNPQVGFWIITPSGEFYSGGPFKQDLTSHVGPTCLSMFHSTHYAGRDFPMKFDEGEPWKKVFGPYFIHLNSVSNDEDPLLLWEKAKQQMSEEVRKWPYDFPSSKDFPKPHQRGSVRGTLLVQDRYMSKTPIPANSAWVGLAKPGEPGSWQRESKGYQFWVQADDNGDFVIEGVHEGTYSLYARVPGFIGDYKYDGDVKIKHGNDIKLVRLIYKPPREGQTLWEIGVPDYSAAEFFVPEPNPNLTNKCFLQDDQNKFRQYGLWDQYSDLYPEHDLIYTIGVSDYHRDWYYVHVPRRNDNMTYSKTTWQIIFRLRDVSEERNYTLQLALASAAESELQVRFNNHDLSALPHYTTKLIGKDNAIARHGIHGLYWLFSVNVQGSWLRRGNNIIYLTQSRDSSPWRGVMYDYIRLEGPMQVSDMPELD